MSYLVHYGIKGMKCGVRRYQNPDGKMLEDYYRNSVGSLLEKYASNLKAGD